jgi:hypothetical protein
MSAVVKRDPLDWATVLWDGAHKAESLSHLTDTFRAADHDRLAEVAANSVLNDWCASVADYGDHDSDPHGHGKRLPYIGWYWRSVDFARKRITVGDCGDFIGFMENNKWGHPERDLSPDECDHVIDLLWRARREGSRGGNLAEIFAARDEVLTELWGWMQDLTDIEAAR